MKFGAMWMVEVLRFGDDDTQASPSSNFLVFYPAQFSYKVLKWLKFEFQEVYQL